MVHGVMLLSRQRGEQLRGAELIDKHGRAWLQLHTMGEKDAKTKKSVSVMTLEPSVRLMTPFFLSPCVYDVNMIREKCGSEEPAFLVRLMDWKEVAKNVYHISS